MTGEFLFYFRFEMLDLRFEIVERLILSHYSILINFLSQISYLNSQFYLTQTR